jgi:AcrR family transcriptional regulator
VSALATRTPRRGRDGAKTRAAIEREALRLFAAKGVEGASIKDIAQAVGVADAALYRHFASKEEMAQAIFARHYGELAQAIGEIARSALPFPAKARALIGHFCALFDEEPDVFSFLLLNQHAHLRFVPKEVEGNAVEAIRTMMAAAYAAGEISQADPDLAAALALGAVAQPAIFTLYGRLPRPLGARAEAMAAAALAVVGAR